MSRLSLFLLLLFVACSGPSGRPAPDRSCEGENCEDVGCGVEGVLCADGEACLGDSDCASGRCVAQVCQEHEPNCDPENEPYGFQCVCSESSECLSGRCVDSHCDAVVVTDSDLWMPRAYQERIGERLAFDCAPNLPSTSLWGTGIYTFDSGVCTAAVHAGRFSRSKGGRVVVEIWPGQSSYVGSTKNGVTSSSWGSYDASFAVLPLDACIDGRKSEDEIDVDCGGDCGPCSDGQMCVADDDCSSAHCRDGICDPSTCSNGRKDGGEEDVDCGGPCAPCIPPQSCAVDADCDEGVCIAQICRKPPACDEVATDRSFECVCETSTQCQSSACVESACGARVVSGSGDDRLSTTVARRVGERFAFDCPPNASLGTIYGTDVYTGDSRVCAAGVHAGVVTHAEGGRVVIEIWPGRSFYAASNRHGVQSRSWDVTSTSYVVLPVGQCADGVKGDGETDVDCGGVCGACPLEAACAESLDCNSGNCESGSCAKPLCSNARLDPGEVDVDCGGPCGKCALGKSCEQNGDCSSGECRDGTCAKPYCSDDQVGQLETDVDCGGPDCAVCGVQKTCNEQSDCVSLVCGSGVCVGATCSDGVRNGSETGVDCGGHVCGPCQLGAACKRGSDCESRNCESSICAATSGCTNGVKDGDETDVDCGGSCVPCGSGSTCSERGDCASSPCQDGICEIPVAGQYTSLSSGVAEGRRWSFRCPPEIGQGSVWGVDVYTGDSAICTAAVHAGLHSFATGGLVTLEERKGLDAYGGSTANGVMSWSYGTYSRSYAFVPSGPCANGVKNGNETDVDCGGGVCAKCTVGALCGNDDDCQASRCVAGRCAQ